MPLGDNTGRLMYDTCATNQSVRDNREIFKYLMIDEEDLRGNDPPPHRGINACDYSMWDGYGLNRGVINGDSEMRMHRLTQHGDRGPSLNVRTFHAVPDVSRGASMPNRESALIYGGISAADQRSERGPHENTIEVDFDRYDPVLIERPRKVDNIVPKWTRGGDSSRNITRTDAYLEKMRQARKLGTPNEPPPYAAHDPTTIATSFAEPIRTGNVARAAPPVGGSARGAPPPLVVSS